MKEYAYGALKPQTDVRDYKVKAMAASFPKIYVVPFQPDVKNQGSVGSCVAHATSEILETLNYLETNNYVPMSTNFIYGMQGVAFGRMEGGMYLRDACKIVKEYGDAERELVPGNTEQPKCTERLKETLTDEVYKNALNYRIDSYARCNDEKSIKHALMNYGPILASIKWYDKHEVKDGVLSFDKTSPFGYHAIMIYGWNEQGWLIQNSWGKWWGDKGHFIYPYKESFTEAWSFVDATNSDEIKQPKVNNILNIVYKVVNGIVNFIKKFFK